MDKCDHKCSKCGEEWLCDFPYYSNHQYFEEVIQQGSYCNAWCPNCDAEERENIKQLFESDGLYFKKKNLTKI